MRRKIVQLLGFVLLLGPSAIAQADIVLMPPGLIAGDTFRIVFVTSTVRDASSTVISDYDAFVTSAAAAGSQTSLTYGGSPVTWQAIGSTSTTNANDIGRLPVSSNVPIFLVDGTKVANDGADLWDGSIAVPISLDENGLLTAGVSVGTGASPSGEIGFGFAPLGGPSVAYGETNFSNDEWVASNAIPGGGIYHFYGVSSPLTAVPEPGVVSLIGTFALGGILLRQRRRRKSTLASAA